MDKFKVMLSHINPDNTIIIRHLVYLHSHINDNNKKFIYNVMNRLIKNIYNDKPDLTLYGPVIGRNQFYEDVEYLERLWGPLPELKEFAYRNVYVILTPLKSISQILFSPKISTPPPSPFLNWSSSVGT